MACFRELKRGNAYQNQKHLKKGKPSERILPDQKKTTYSREIKNNQDACSSTAQFLQTPIFPADLGVSKLIQNYNTSQRAIFAKCVFFGGGGGKYRWGLESTSGLLWVNEVISAHPGKLACRVRARLQIRLYAHSGPSCREAIVPQQLARASRHLREALDDVLVPCGKSFGGEERRQGRTRRALDMCSCPGMFPAVAK